MWIKDGQKVIFNTASMVWNASMHAIKFLIVMWDYNCDSCVSNSKLELIYFWIIFVVLFVLFYKFYRLPLIVSVHFFILLFITTAFNFILICCMQRCPSKVWSLVLFFFSVVLMYRKMFNSVNEYNLSEKQLSGCQSMIAWFSDVNESDTKKIMCHTFNRKHCTLVIFTADIIIVTI